VSVATAATAATAVAVVPAVMVPVELPTGKRERGMPSKSVITRQEKGQSLHVSVEMISPTRRYPSSRALSFLTQHTTQHNSGLFVTELGTRPPVASEIRFFGWV
jgi:hypothetical protein